MKKLLIIAGIALLAASAGECVSQPNNLGEIKASTATFTGGVALWNLPAARILTLTAKTTGQVILCSDCQIKYAICVSTGSTAPYQWTLSTGTACK